MREFECLLGVQFTVHEADAEAGDTKLTISTNFAILWFATMNTCDKRRTSYESAADT